MYTYLPLFLALVAIAAIAAGMTYLTLMRPYRLRIANMEHQIVSLCSRGIVTKLLWGCTMQEMGVDFLVVEGAGWRFEPLLVRDDETYAVGQVPHEVMTVFGSIMDGHSSDNRDVALAALERVHRQRGGTKVFAVDFTPGAARSLWSSVQQSRTRSQRDQPHLRSVS